MAVSLYLGALFPPSQGQASLFGSIFGNDASASAPIPSPIIGKADNSQTMDLLQANSLSTLPPKLPKTSTINKSSKDTTTPTVDESSNVSILSENALVPEVSPFTPTARSHNTDPSNDQASVYVVRQGDSISQIASMFGVSVNTIIWANDMKKGDKLTEGQVLVILPVSGVEHTVTKGQTVQSIAKIYKADVNEIMDFNGLTPSDKLSVGDKLLIPNAEKSNESGQPVKDLGASIAKDTQYYITHPIKSLFGYFLNPVPGARKSQGVHDNNAVDLAIGKGTPIYAAASGVVYFAKNGCIQGQNRCGSGFGNYVIISHPNGLQTLYAHQSSEIVQIGESVNQGQVIGYVGSTGRSTGAHLHFEVHGARNPGADGSWAQ